MPTNIKKLNNPVWNSLSESHPNFAIEFNGIKFYHPDYCPFGGFINLDKTEEAIDHYTELTKNFYVVGDKPIFRPI